MAISPQTTLPSIPDATTNEKLIVGKLVDDLLAAGFVLSVDDGEEITVHRSIDREAIFAALCSTETDRLIAKRGEMRGWVLLVWGNDCDVISDYTTNIESHLSGANALANELEG